MTDENSASRQAAAGTDQEPYPFAYGHGRMPLFMKLVWVVALFELQCQLAAPEGGQAGDQHAHVRPPSSEPHRLAPAEQVVERVLDETADALRFAECMISKELDNA